GQTSFLAGVVAEVGSGLIRTHLTSTGAVITSNVADRPVSVGDQVQLAIRSEKIETRPTGGGENVVDARIASFVYVGSAYEYIFQTAVGEIRASSPEAIEGPEVHLYLPPDAIVVLADESTGLPLVADPAATTPG